MVMSDLVAASLVCKRGSSWHGARPPWPDEQRLAGPEPHRIDGDHIAQRIIGRPRIARKRPAKQSAEAMGQRLLAIVVYDRCCWTGATLTLGDLAETEVGDRKMPDYTMACSYAASQGWLIVADDAVTLTTAGLGAA